MFKGLTRYLRRALGFPSPSMDLLKAAEGTHEAFTRGYERAEKLRWPCTCTSNPSNYDGPARDCPEHGERCPHGYRVGECEICGTGQSACACGKLDCPEPFSPERVKQEMRFLACGSWHPHPPHEGCLGVTKDSALGKFMRHKED